MRPGSNKDVRRLPGDVTAGGWRIFADNYQLQEKTKANSQSTFPIQPTEDRRSPECRPGRCSPPCEGRGSAVRLLRQAPYDPAEEPGKEYGDYVVCDPEERRIGHAKQFCANTRRAGVRGGKGELLGLSCVLIPVGFVSVDEERRTITLH